MTEPVEYMERTRDYYRAQGFERDYEWACARDVPFARLERPLAESTLGLVTTSMPFALVPDRTHKEVCSSSVASPPERMYADDLAWDRQATHLDDLDSFLPVHRLAELSRQGRFARLAERFHCLPTEYSQRRTREIDAPEIERRLREDGADVALLVPL